MPQKVDTTEQQVPSSFTWRIFRIMSEFVEGFQFLVGLKRTVTFFGSSRVKPGSVYYKKAEDLASRLSKAKFTVITGGGPGIMEAVNKGATLAGGESIGLNIQLPFEQRMNTYVKRGIGFHYFFTRKVILSFSAQAYVYFPGGIWAFGLVFLIMTFILIGREYWKLLIAWLESTVLVKQRAIEEDDLELFQVTDSVDEAFRIIKKSKERPRVFTE